MSQPEERDPYAPPETADSGPGLPHEAPRGTPSSTRRGPGLLPAGIAALVAAFVFPPMGIPLCLLLVVYVVRSRRRAVAAGSTPPSGSLATLVVAAVGLTVPLVVLAVFFTEITEYQSCVSAANTHAARVECDAAFEDALRERVPVP